MNLGILLATFGLVIPAELPDKTFISCLVMSSRHRPLPVWVGGASALSLQAGLSVAAGRLLELLPRTAVRGVVAALFIGGALYLLVVPERTQEDKGHLLAGAAETSDGETGGARCGGGEDGAGDTAPPEAVPPRDLSPESFLRVALTTFSIVALAEFGDITQILVANLTARYHASWSVFLGAVAGFWVVSAIGVASGRAIVRVVPLALVRRLSGAALLALGIYTIVQIL